MFTEDRAAVEVHRIKKRRQRSK